MTQQFTFHYPHRFILESGAYLESLDLFYTTFGTLNAEKDNVIWVCHALTGNSNFTEWWPGLFGKGCLYDPEKYFIICANTLGGCYGSTGPLSLDPRRKVPYFHGFPRLTNRDIIRSFDLLRNDIGITKINTLIGGSLGGQHAIEWAVYNSKIVDNLVLLASNAQHSPWGIAFNESQRMAIEQDITWQLNTPTAGLKGMKVARSIALLSYRSYQTYQNTQFDKTNNKTEGFLASSYQRYQGEKLAKRFNAFTYWTLSIAMDSHNIGRDRGGIAVALSQIEARTLVVGIKSDILFPTSEQKLIANGIPEAEYVEIDSLYGHDGFLIEVESITSILRNFYTSKKRSVSIKA
jgi:homoserine O-acetyltransferase/O-succinyltransferase